MKSLAFFIIGLTGGVILFFILCVYGVSHQKPYYKLTLYDETIEIQDAQDGRIIGNFLYDSSAISTALLEDNE